MRLRLLAALTAMSLSSGVAFADAGSTSAGVKAASGVMVAGGGAGAIAVVTHLFSNKSEGHAMAVTKAPEISTSGMTAGLVLLAGGILIARGRQRTQETVS